MIFFLEDGNAYFQRFFEAGDRVGFAAKVTRRVRQAVANEDAE
jgi:hypothetical protein